MPKISGDGQVSITQSAAAYSLLCIGKKIFGSGAVTRWEASTHTVEDCKKWGMLRPCSTNPRFYRGIGHLADIWNVWNVWNSLEQGLEHVPWNMEHTAPCSITALVRSKTD